MCKSSNLFVVDLFSEAASGSIILNVANSIPRLMNNPCKIVVKQVQSSIAFQGLLLQVVLMIY